MDRASDYGSEGWGFESLQGHIKNAVNHVFTAFFSFLHMFLHIMNIIYKTSKTKNQKVKQDTINSKGCQ